MKIEWLITEVTAVGSPIRAEIGVSGSFGIFCFWPSYAAFKIDRSTANVTAVGSPIRAEKELFGAFLTMFGQVGSLS